MSCLGYGLAREYVQPSFSSILPPPEYLESNTYTKKSDVFAFALLIVEIFTGKEGADIEQSINSSNIPSTLKNLTHHCSSHNPSSRPEFEEIMETLEEYYGLNWQENLFHEAENGIQQLYISLVEKDEIIEANKRKIATMASKIADLEKTLSLRAVSLNTSTESLSSSPPFLQMEEQPFTTSTQPITINSNNLRATATNNISSSPPQLGVSPSSPSSSRRAEEGERKRSDTLEDKPLLINAPPSKAEQNIVADFASKVLKKYKKKKNTDSHFLYKDKNSLG